MLDFPNAFDWRSATKTEKSAYIHRKQLNGFSFRDIGQELGVSLNSISSHVTNHMRRFGYASPKKGKPIDPSNTGRLAITRAITERASIKVPMPECSIRYVTRRHGIQCAAIVDGIDETIRDEDGLRPQCGAPITRGQYCAFHASIYLTGKSK
jgi:hypothetical protein